MKTLNIVFIMQQGPILYTTIRIVAKHHLDHTDESQKNKREPPNNKVHSPCIM